MLRSHWVAQTNENENICHLQQIILSPQSHHLPSPSSTHNDCPPTFNKSSLPSTSMSDLSPATDGTVSTVAYPNIDKTASILFPEGNDDTNGSGKHHSSGQGANNPINNISSQNHGNNSSASINSNFHQNEDSVIDHVEGCSSHAPTTSSKVADGNNHHLKGKARNERLLKHESMGTADTLRKFATAALALSSENGHNSYSANPRTLQRYFSSSAKNSSTPSTSSPSIGSDYSTAADLSSFCDGTTDCAKQDSTYRKKKDKKKDKSRLRKGKWTPEEEEFTKRIIHHFSSGQLILPEGTTLRSYLAEKLTCDPMRITKKFAGASCLGKRVYHICDRSKTTSNDVEMAKAELAALEHRFRLRTEHGLNGVTLLHRVAAEGIHKSRSYMLNAAVAGSVSGVPSTHNLNDGRGGMMPVSAPSASSVSVSHDAMMQQSQFANITAAAVVSAAMANPNTTSLHAMNPTLFLAQQLSHQQHPLAQLSQNHAAAAAGLLPSMLLPGASSQLTLNMILAMNQNNLSAGNNTPIQEYNQSAPPPSPLSSNPRFPLTPTSTPVSNLFPTHISQVAASIQYGQRLSSSLGKNASSVQASVSHSVVPFNEVVAAASIPGFQQMQQSHQHVIAAAALAAAAAARAQGEIRTVESIRNNTSDAATGNILQSCNNNPPPQSHEQKSNSPDGNKEKMSETNEKEHGNTHTPDAPHSTEIAKNVTRSEEDKAAGNALLEILSTLRKRHADAMEKVRCEEEQKEIDEADKQVIASKININASCRTIAKSDDNTVSPPQAAAVSLHGSSHNHAKNNSCKPPFKKALIKKQEKQQRDLLSSTFSQHGSPAVVTAASSRYDNNNNRHNVNASYPPLSIGRNSSTIITCSDISSETASSLSQHIHQNNGNNSGSNKTDLSSSGDNSTPDPSGGSTSGSGVGSSDDDDNSDKIARVSPLKSGQNGRQGGDDRQHEHEHRHDTDETNRNKDTHVAAHPHHRKRFMSEWKHRHYGEFTKRNLADHTTRMDALQSQHRKNGPHEPNYCVKSKSSLSTIGSASCRNHSMGKRRKSSMTTPSSVGINDSREKFLSTNHHQEQQSWQRLSNVRFHKRVKISAPSDDR